MYDVTYGALTKIITKSKSDLAEAEGHVITSCLISCRTSSSFTLLAIKLVTLNKNIPVQIADDQGMLNSLRIKISLY